MPEYRRENLEKIMPKFGICSKNGVFKQALN